MAVSNPAHGLEVSVGLPEVLAGLLALIELAGHLLGSLLAEGDLHEPGGVPALGAGEPLGLDPGLTLGADRDLDGLAAHAPFPTEMVSLMLPSGRGCSRT